jgi:alkylation response protein AidB-like acyl-CoA dehydrogenase
MHVAFSPDQLHLRDAARRVLSEACTASVVRAAWSGEEDPALWRAIADLGALGVAAPERCGGLALGLLDAVLIYEEAGEVALPVPLVEMAAVAVPLMVEAGLDTWVERVASGQARVAVGLDGDHVLDADRADIMLAEREGAVFLVTRDAMTTTRQPSVDHARRLFTVAWEHGERLPVSPDQVRAARDRGAVGTAAQLVGLSRRLLNMTVEYVSARRQFGRPVGAFQAVQHALANALVDLTFAAPLAYRAAWSLDQGSPEASVHASMAKAFASDAASKVARTALQCHGAMGYSFEYDLHLWMKRVWCLSRSWGDARRHRAYIGDVLGLPGATSTDDLRGG